MFTKERTGALCIEFKSIDMDFFYVTPLGELQHLHNFVTHSSNRKETVKDVETL